MKKQRKISMEIGSLTRLLKKMRITKNDKGLLESAHRLLALQLKAIKKTTDKVYKSGGLVFHDSRVLPRPEGVRPAAVETARLKYQIEDKQLQISLYPVSPERFEVIGRLDGISSGKIIGVILKSDRKKITTLSNEFQIFRFENIQKASYQLEINDGQKTIAKVTLNL